MDTQTSDEKAKLDWCSFEAAKFACLNYHYSKSVPAGKLVKIGVWEQGAFKGCILFGRGANNNLGKPYGLSQAECSELVRIALRDHATPVSRLVRIAISMLKKQSPGLKLIVSYADEAHQHLGGIYQAGNWLYTGHTASESAIDPKTGQVKHIRSLISKYGSIAGFKRVKDAPKHRYLMPLDAHTRSTVISLSREYPKRVIGAVVAQPDSIRQTTVQIRS